MAIWMPPGNFGAVGWVAEPCAAPAGAAAAALDADPAGADAEAAPVVPPLSPLLPQPMELETMTAAAAMRALRF